MRDRSDSVRNGGSKRRRPSDFLPRAIRRHRREEGQALVEIALVIPLLLLVLFAIIQFGLVLNTYITVTDSARAGARQLALEQGNNDPCDPAVQVATNAGSSAKVLTSQVTISFTSATATTTTSSTDFCVSANTTTPAPYSYPAGNTSTSETDAGNEIEGDTATLTINKPYLLQVFGFGIFHLTLSASASDAVE